MRIRQAVLRLCFLGALLTGVASAQTTKIEPTGSETEGSFNLFLNMGQSFLKKGEYYNAIPHLKKAYVKERNQETKTSILYKIGYAYRNMNDHKSAEEWFAKAIKNGYENPVAVLYLAEAQKAQGHYSDALNTFKSYKALVPDDVRGNNGILSCEYSKEWIDKPTKYVVENVEAINTRYQDFCLTFSKRNPRIAIFTSTREDAMGKEDDGWTGQKYSDLFQTIRDDKGKWSTPQPLKPPVNSEFNDGAATFDRSGRLLFYTKCNPGKGQNGYCNIYVAVKKGDNFENPKPLQLVGDSITIGHPALSPDEKTLYFSAQMPGGYGGKDIYMSVRDEKSNGWSKPINLGPKINTAGEEMYPWISADNTLYFSSNGLVGMGGLDIYKSKFAGARTASSYQNNPKGISETASPLDTLTGDSPILDLGPITKRDTINKKADPVDSVIYYAQAWSDPVNMKYPINSSFDDFSIIFEEGPNEQGYFSSTREGGKGSDDIYRFRLPPLEFTIQGKVMDVDNRGGIKGASVELIGSDGSIVTVKTDRKGVYIFDKTMVKANVVYQLTASSKDYLNAKGVQSTVGLTESTDLFQDAFLLKSTKKPFEIPNIYYDYDKATLRPESKVNLDSVVVILNENPKLVVQINSHTDSRGSDEHNDDLSQRRAQSVVDYLISRGMDPDRLVAKGYGKHKLKITDEQVASMKSEKEKEAAHQMNRRTEFEKLRDDYVPKAKPLDGEFRDSLGQKVKVSKPILSAKDSAFFNLKKDGTNSAHNPNETVKPENKPANPAGNNQNNPAGNKPETPVLPKTEPAKKDSVPAKDLSPDR